MVTLGSLFGMGKGEQREVESALARIDHKQDVVRLELERTLIRFNTRLSVRRGAVVVAKPPALGAQLAAGTIVRLHLPGAPPREIRLEVATPHFNLSNNQAAFLCKMPTGFAEPSQRKKERYDTARYQNLRLALPGHEEFRVLDICESGCRALTPYRQPAERLPRSERFGDGQLAIGKNVRVSLAVVTPRSYHGKAVGVAYSVDPGGDNRKLLHHLLKSLETAQREAMRAELPA
jgi:hypothetical protein